MPICESFCVEAAFIPWQGKVSALLGFNSKLQSDFQGAANSIEHTIGGQNSLGLDNLPNIQRANVTIRRIIDQAMSELELAVQFPEPLQPSPSSPSLTDENGIWWFISNSTVGVRWQLILAAIGICITVLLVGIGLGQTDFIRNLYIQFHNPQMPRPINNPTTPQPTAQPTSANTPESTGNK
jgi:hypothetical protein